MLLRRQEAYNGTWRTRIDFDPADEWEEAGTTVFYSRFSYIALLVRKDKDGKKEVVVRWTDASDGKKVKVNSRFSSRMLERTILADCAIGAKPSPALGRSDWCSRA